MARKKFASGLLREDDYQWKRDHADKYQMWWGTAGSKSTKVTWSIKHATHPLIAWAEELQDLAKKIGTPAELLQAQNVLHELKHLADFDGFRTWTIHIAAANLRGEATISRIKPTK